MTSQEEKSANAAWEIIKKADIDGSGVSKTELNNYINTLPDSQAVILEAALKALAPEQNITLQNLQTTMMQPVTSFTMKFPVAGGAEMEASLDGATLKEFDDNNNGVTTKGEAIKAFEAIFEDVGLMPKSTSAAVKPAYIRNDKEKQNAVS